MTADSPAVVANFAQQIEQARKDFLAACPAKEEPQEQPVPSITPYPLVSVGEVLKCPPLRWRVKGLIPARGIGQIYGASTAGKSFLSLDLAVHVARGRTWYGHKTKAAPVVIFSLEGQEGTRNRLAAYLAYHGEELPPNLSIGTAPTTFYKPEDLEAITASLPDGCLCIVDTQACASVGLDENRTDDMTLLIEGCKQIAASKDCFVLLTHHAGKDLTRGARGSSTQLPSWDCCIEATRNGQQREWKAVKVKDGGGEGEKHPFRLAVVDLGADEDGDRITSCVALPDGEALQEEKPLSPALNYALESLRTALQKAGADSIHVDDWRPTFYAGHTADNDNAKKVAFHRDRNKLVTLGKICVENNRYSFATTPGTSQHRHNTVTSDAPVTSQHVTHPFKGCDDVTLCDEDGEPKTSCVVEPDNTPVQEEKPLTPSLKYALESLEAALNEDGGNSVHVEAWRKHYYAKSTADNTHAKKTAFLRVRKELATMGKVTVLNDMYSIPGTDGTTGTTGTDGTDGTDGTHSFRSVPCVPPCEGPGYE